MASPRGPGEREKGGRDSLDSNVFVERGKQQRSRRRVERPITHMFESLEYSCVISVSAPYMRSLMCSVAVHRRGGCAHGVRRGFTSSAMFDFSFLFSAIFESSIRTVGHFGDREVSSRVPQRRWRQVGGRARPSSSTRAAL
jgi:hypothetical protein